MSKIKKNVTLQMIADRAGVSTVTVSNVLLGKKGASEEVRGSILALAKEMGYHKKEGDESGGSKRIGVVIAERYVKETPSFYMDIYKRISQEAARQGALTILEVVDQARERLEEPPIVFSNAAIDGILMLGEVNPGFLETVRTNSLQPAVCVDFYDADKDMDFIITDGFRGMQAITQRLIDYGHRQITFVGTPGATGSIMDRYMGYCKALLLNHIPELPPLQDRKKEGYASVAEFELPEVLPTAYVCNCEKSAALLIKKLREKGIAVPDEVSVAAYDRVHGSQVEGLELMTYENDEKIMAEISVSTLLKRIHKNGTPAGIRLMQGKVHEGNSIMYRRKPDGRFC
ncbi:LacI family DNA-binding transcriptional regulator [Clostridium sp. Marseille-P2415]|uniref:LacI family DNA-binding transcriptional regulator n=1 Tax=Clostridium sp. Marseille-P2415 TaxID=1805471 RepID=UPI0009885D26|nr:LacI family DNA-binding transcriptional regulator [Clostridium sp. Marseille-P2415]